MNGRNYSRQSGGILIMTLVFVVMFAGIFLALSSVTNRQYRESVLLAHDELAFQVAEAGLNYARWRLAHDAANFTAEGREVADQQGAVIGAYEVTFEAPIPGSTIVNITSVGATSSRPLKEVTLQARYGIPSLARYSLVVNEDVWMGGGAVKGALHSNGGVRMDSTSDNVVSSAKETYICQIYHGCGPTEKPGVWGNGGNQELWEFPVPPVNYGAITLDLEAMQDAAEQTGTAYGAAGAHGYHLVFNANNTYTLYRVTQKRPNIWSWGLENGWEFSSYDINRQALIGTYGVPSNGVIFFEDTVWIEGEIRDRVTVAAGRLDQANSTADIIINGNITYGGVHDGSRVLGAVAERHVLLPYYGAANVLTMEGAYIAQNGRFGRRHYNSGAHRYKNSITKYGMVASNMVPVTTWTFNDGTLASGYQTGSTEYDPHLLYGPPPYFPTSGEYQFISWERVE